LVLNFFYLTWKAGGKPSKETHALVSWHFKQPFTQVPPSHPITFHFPCPFSIDHLLASHISLSVARLDEQSFLHVKPGAADMPEITVFVLKRQTT